MLTRHDLRSRGWSHSALKKHGVRCSVHDRGVTLYDPAKVAVVENEIFAPPPIVEPEPEVGAVGLVARIDAGMIDHRSSRRAVVNELIGSFQVEIATISLGSLIRLLIQANKLNGVAASVTGNALLAFARHNLTNYHAALLAMRRKVVEQDQHDALRARFNDAVYAAIPELRENRIYT